MNDLTYRIVRTLPDACRESFDTLQARCFPLPENPVWQAEIIDQYWCKDDASGYVLALQENTVVGAIVLHKREIVFQGRTGVLGGLGGVCTREDLRNRGIASRMVLLAMEELSRAGCDVAYLCTDVDSPALVRLYARGGFVVLHRPHTYQGKSGRRYTDTDAMVAPVNSEALFREILNDSEPFDIGGGNW